VKSVRTPYFSPSMLERSHGPGIWEKWILLKSQQLMIS
jgi:hypothetical protein